MKIVRGSPSASQNR